MTKPKYKILIVRDEQGFCDYADWLSGNSHADYQIQEIELADYLIASQVNGSLELSQLTWADCMVWDSISKINREEYHLFSVPIVILVSEPEELAGLNFLLKATITKELLSSTICHGITQAELRRRLEQAEVILKEQELLKHKLQLEQSVNLLLHSIHSSFDLSTIFTAATTGIGKLLKLDRVEITQYLPEQEIWTPIVEYLDRQDIPSALGKVIPDQNNEISNKLKQGEIVIINSYTDIECSINRDLLEQYPGSWLIVPLVVGSTVWGVISLDCHYRHRHWLDMEVDLAINISTQLAIAIQQSNFYHQVQLELSQRQKTKDLLELQNQFLGCIAMGDPLPETLTLIAHLLEVYMTGGIYAVLIFDDRNYLECIAAPSLPKDYRQVISGMTIAEVETTFGNSWGLDLTEPSPPKYQEFIATHNLNFCWATPIMDREQQKLLGIFVLYHQQPQPSGSEIQINRIVAHVVGIAIERHQSELNLRKQLEREQNLLQQLQQELCDRQAAEAKRNQVEQALVESEKRYRQVVETQNDYILRSLEDTTITFANEALCRSIGVGLEQIIGQKWSDFVVPEDFSQTHLKILELTPENPTFLRENQDLRAGKHIGWTQWINLGIFNEHGQLLEIQSVGRDITELKQAEAKLQQLNQELESKIEKRTADLRRSKEILQISEQRFRSFFTLAPIGIAVVDAHTYQLVAVNQAYCQLLDYTEAEVLEIESCASLSEPADWELEMPLIDSLIRGGLNSYQLEQRYIRKNGTIVIGDITATKICDRVNNVTHIIKMVQNITQQKQDKEALKRSEERLRLTIENTPIGILTLGLDGKFLTVNHDACRIFGYSAKELFQMTALDLTHPNSRELTLNTLNQIATGQLIKGQIEKQYIDKSGKIIDAISRVGIVRDEQSNPLHFVVGVEDVTEKKQIEKALNQQFERQRFITKITQQIRQSLNLDDVLTAAVNEVNSLLNCDRVIIFQLLNNGDNKVVREVVKEIVKTEYPSILDMSWKDEHFSDQGFEYYINSQSRIVNNVPQDDFASCIAEFMAFAQVKSKIVAPIVQNIQSPTPNSENRWQQDNSQLWGLLIVHSCGEQRQWQPEEADLLQQVANQLAIAIQQADLYAQIANELSTRKHLELELSRQAAADRLLSEITIAINESSQLDKVLDISLQKVQQLLESDRVLIFQIGADGNGKVIKESVSNPALSILNEEISDSCFATTDLGEQYLQGKVTILEDIQTANITSCYADLMHKYHIKANLAAPIIHSNQLWGLLLVHQCHKPRVWLPYEINLIKQVATQIGISAHKEKLNLRLTSELHQKEILLKEIHHRVKNNLQVMSSLLRMQFRKSTPEVKTLCEEYQNQIQSMALIHDQLHQSNDLANINFHSYIVNLANNLFHCYGANSELVQLHLSVENIFLPLDQSIPLGLIINELISNALKHAFPKSLGEINIALSQKEQLLQLVVADNGVGIPQNFDIETTNSMGLQLVYSLTDQLEGKVICDSLGDTPQRHRGTRFEITFPIG